MLDKEKNRRAARRAAKKPGVFSGAAVRTAERQPAGGQQMGNRAVDPGSRDARGAVVDLPGVDQYPFGQ